MACTPKEVTSSFEPTETNSPPSATINSPYPGEEIANGALFVAWGEATDNEDLPEDLRVSWLIAGEERCSPSAPTEGEGRTRCDVSFSFDKQSITFRVEDSAGDTAEQTVDIRLVENTGPTVTITSPTPDQRYRINDLINFEGTVSDGEDSPEGLQVWWESDVEGVLDDLGLTVMSDGRVTGTGTLTLGTHILRLLALDTSGRESNASIVIEVVQMAIPPEIEIISPTDGEQFEVGSTINFEAQISDEMTPTEELQVEWRSSIEAGILSIDGATEDNTVQFSTNALALGEHVITLTVTDDDGDRAQKSTMIEVVDHPVESDPTDTGTATESSDSDDAGSGT